MDDTNLMRELSNLFSQTKLNYNEEQIAKLVKLAELLIKWNKKLNLTAITDPMDILILHVMDSAVVSPYVSGQRIADLGTGQGFPGLVLAILNEDKRFTLIDSVAKKLAFVRNAIVALEIKNVSIINDRCENIKPAEKFDCIVSRAFAPLDRMLKWSLPLIAENGYFLAMKGDIKEDELKAIPNSVMIKDIVDIKVPNLEAQRKIVILKQAN
ncbi:MAG: 16S rRNA (guanine(527)-N(7))-methyltransferase RsmG [Succinivibrio sp.]|nr:16S rRNA (guanine(527)-N(7))-methyltransferase RsmG [Succinivibrio sp.]